MLFPTDGFYRVECHDFVAGVTIRDGLVVQDGTAPIFSEFGGNPSGYFDDWLQVYSDRDLKVERMGEA